MVSPYSALRYLLIVFSERCGWSRLSAMAAEYDIPLIVDNAYGTPFPNVMFMDASPIWNDNVILTMSLSKLGLPGVRTGIVVAHEEVVAAVSALNAIVSLAPGSFGAVLTHEMIRSGEVVRLSRDVIRPFYESRCERALAWIRESLDGLNATQKDRRRSQRRHSRCTRRSLAKR